MGKATDVSGSKSDPIFIDELHEGIEGLLTVLVCRKWDVLSINKKYMSTDYIMSDKKGNIIHCYAKSFIAHRFQKILEEGCLYSIKAFAVVPNPEKYRVLKDSDYMIDLQGSTVVRKATDEIEKFNRYPFQLVPFEELTPTDNKHFVDVIGYVTIVGSPSKKSTGKKTVEFNLTNERAYQLRVTLWEDYGDEMVKRKSKNPGTYIILLTGMIAKEYLGNLCLSNSSATMLIDDAEIPAIKTFKDAISVVDVIDTGLPVLQVRPTLDTLKQLLEWGREKRKREIAAFRNKVMITNIRTKNSWFNYTCTLGKCRKGVTPNQKGSFWCESCSTEVSYLRPRYRIQADVTDGTADIVVVLFDETAEKLVGCPTKSLLADAEQDESGDSYVMPHVLQQLIGTSHVFEIKSHTYYQVADYESFNCSQIVADLPESEVKKEEKKPDEKKPDSFANPLEKSDAEDAAQVLNSNKGFPDNVESDVFRGKKRQLEEANIVGCGKKPVK
uniref:replication protein A 70 kDa DNA-binding subunit-like n=1 Tax=Erigeron canadensis TaxID=72917 RepID=UPI001CB9B729|nr:replication protein A 70 kDa DNA-binding subunit-like [Erigeron canadensis]